MERAIAHARAVAAQWGACAWRRRERHAAQALWDAVAENGLHKVRPASRLLREAARVELGRQGMRVWEGEVLTHDEWAARLDATINERVAAFESELRGG